MEVLRHKKEKMQAVNLLNNLLLVTLVFAGTSSFGQPENRQEAYRLIEDNFSAKEDETFKISEQTISFPKDYLAHQGLFDIDTLKKKFITWNLHATAQIKLFDTLLHQDDLDQIKKRVLKRKLTKLKRHKLSLNNLVFISKEEIDQLKKKPFPKHTVYEVSWPVFSIDGQLAMIYEEKICGIECGGGQINIFHKDAEGKWAILGVLPTKVS